MKTQMNLTWTGQELVLKMLSADGKVAETEAVVISDEAPFPHQIVGLVNEFTMITDCPTADEIEQHLIETHGFEISIETVEWQPLSDVGEAGPFMTQLLCTAKLISEQALMTYHEALLRIDFEMRAAAVEKDGWYCFRGDTFVAYCEERGGKSCHANITYRSELSPNMQILTALINCFTMHMDKPKPLQIENWMIGQYGIEIEFLGGWH